MQVLISIKGRDPVFLTVRNADELRTVTSVLQTLSTSGGLVSMDGVSVQTMPDHVDDERRCAICGWPLESSIDLGCIRGNCSHRPFPERMYSPARAQKEYKTKLKLSSYDQLRVDGTQSNSSELPELTEEQKVDKLEGVRIGGRKTSRYIPAVIYPPGDPMGLDKGVDGIVNAAPDPLMPAVEWKPFGKVNFGDYIPVISQDEMKQLLKEQGHEVTQGDSRGGIRIPVSPIRGVAVQETEACGTQESDKS